MGHVPFSLVHIDTSYKIPEMIEYRDRLTAEWNLDMVYGMNTEAVESKTTFPDGKIVTFVAFWCYEDCVSNIRWFKLTTS